MDIVSAGERGEKEMRDVHLAKRARARDDATKCFVLTANKFFAARGKTVSRLPLRDSEAA